MRTIQYPTWNDAPWTEKLSPRLLDLHRSRDTQPEETWIKVLIDLDSFQATSQMEVPILSLLDNSITSQIPLEQIEQLALSGDVTRIDLA